MIDASLLQATRAPLLIGLTEHDLGVVAAALEEVRFPAGTHILRRGERSRDLYLVVHGRVHLSRHEHDLGTLSPGAHFGEMSLIGGRERAATVEAVDDVVLWRLSHAAWTHVLEFAPRTGAELARRIADKLAEQLVGMTDSVALMYDHDGREHIALPTIDVVLDGVAQTMSVPAGTRLSTVLPPAIREAPVVAAMIGPRPVSLSTPIVAHTRVEPLTLRSWEGREVWRRSVGLLFLAAAHRVRPDVDVTLAHSIGSARVVRCTIDDDGIAAIAREMDVLVHANKPLLREQWSIDEARAHFSARRDAASVASLSTARGPTVAVHGLDGRYAVARGPIVLSTGSLSGTRLVRHPDGLLLSYGASFARWTDDAHDNVIAHEAAHPRFRSPMHRDHERWLHAMGVGSVGAFNDFCISGRVKDLIRNAEGFHEKHIGRIADEIAARGDAVRVIAIAGPSSSGKTTFIKRLTVQLEVNGVHPVALSLDDYYCNREQCPRDENGDYDFEVLHALDTKLLQDHLERLLAGEAVATAHFDFKTGRSTPSGGSTMKLSRGQVLLIEGIHGLNPALVGGAVPSSSMFRIFVQPALCMPFDALTASTPADLRFIRRIVRDRHARGTKAADNILRWSSVRRGEARHIFPFQHHADAVFDTSLAYEMGVLKVYGERYLLEVPPDHPAAPTAYRLRSLLDPFVAIYPDHVPPTSILREFIGGSGFEY